MIHRFCVLWLVATVAFHSVPVLANFPDWVPLKKLPQETDIVAFANRPVFHRKETLSRAEAMRFLAAGTLHSDIASAEKFLGKGPAGNPMPGCSGVFLAKTGELYFWRLFDRRLMCLVTNEGKQCYVSVVQGAALESDPPQEDKNSYRTLIPPTVEDVRWFFNDEPPATGGRELRSQAQVTSFLKAAKPVKCAGVLDEFHLRDDAWLTLPPERAKINRMFHTAMRGDAIQPWPYNKSSIEVQGVLVTKTGKVYYWEQWSDSLLSLRDDAGGTCVLESK